MGVTLKPLLGHFGVSLGSVLLSVGDFASLDGHFAIIVESLLVYVSRGQKNIHFPYNFFNDSMKLLGEVLVDLGLLCVETAMTSLEWSRRPKSLKYAKMRCF